MTLGRGLVVIAIAFLLGAYLSPVINVQRVEATAGSGAGNGFARQVRTLSLPNGYTCTYGKAGLEIWEDIRGCVLGSLPLRTKPVQMDFLWRSAGPAWWWSEAGGYPSGVRPAGLQNLHLAWTGSRVVLFLVSGESEPAGTNVQYEVVYPDGQ